MKLIYVTTVRNRALNRFIQLEMTERIRWRLIYETLILFTRRDRSPYFYFRFWLEKRKSSSRRHTCIHPPWREFSFQALTRGFENYFFYLSLDCIFKNLYTLITLFPDKGTNSLTISRNKAHPHAVYVGTCSEL